MILVSAMLLAVVLIQRIQRQLVVSSLKEERHSPFEKAIIAAPEEEPEAIGDFCMCADPIEYANYELEEALRELSSENEEMEEKERLRIKKHTNMLIHQSNVALDREIEASLEKIRAL